MNKKRIIGIVGTLVVCVGIIIVGKTFSKEKSAVILDEDGRKIAELVYRDKEMFYVCEGGYESYTDLVCKEAVTYVKEKEGLTEREAQEKIVTEEMKISTYFDEKSFQSLKTSYEKSDIINQKNFGVGISDIHGCLKACYSFSKEGTSRNNLAVSTYAGSTIKPLTVYGPGIESGRICWSSMYMDSPYTKQLDEDGNLSDWPTNTKPYQNEMITVEEALKKSNNAVAVKILKDCGVENACEYLERKFGIDVEAEKEIMKTAGEDKVLSNIALGYLKHGVTIPQMLAAYGTFANGGVYYPTHAVKQIENSKDEIYYEKENQGRKVFSEETAFIMNRLLKKVVEEGGTGADAQMDVLDICGKTGTSEKFLNNWFVGMTPEYVCAVWYEGNQEWYLRNESVFIFKEIMENVSHDKALKYPEAPFVEKMEYCKKTGLLANEYCEEKADGFYSQKNVPARCNCKR